MPLTRATLANELVERAGGFMLSAGLSVARDATNPAVMIAGRKALARVDRSPVDPVSLSDADLTGVIAARTEEYLDTAHLEILKVILAHCGKVDQQVGQHEQRLSQLADAVRKAIELMDAHIRDEYGSPASGITAVGVPTTPAIPNNPFDPIASRSREGWWPYP
jgi:hypothetical protein